MIKDDDILFSSFKDEVTRQIEQQQAVIAMLTEDLRFLRLQLSEYQDTVKGIEDNVFDRVQDDFASTWRLIREDLDNKVMSLHSKFEHDIKNIKPFVKVIKNK